MKAGRPVRKLLHSTGERDIAVTQYVLALEMT